MKTMMKRPSVFNKALSVILVIAIILTALSLRIGKTLANPADGAEIISFEQSGVVFEKTVELATVWEDLELPTELRAIFGAESNEPEENEPDGHEAESGEPEENEPDGNEAESGEPEETGPDGNETESGEPEENEPDIHEAESGEPEENEPEETEPEKAQTFVLSVPVTWEGQYNGDEPGVYVLTAKIEGYSYSGELPIAIITVSDTSPIMQSPQRSPPGTGVTADYIIDIGGGKQGQSPYPGYTISNRVLDFTQDASGFAYEIIQTADTAGFWTFNVRNNTSLTIILSGLGSGHKIPDIYFHLHDNAEVKLFLSGENTIGNGYFTVRENTKLTIDSAHSPGTKSESGSLTITSDSSGYAAIGGPSGASSGLITINGGTTNAIKKMPSPTSTGKGAAIGGGESGSGHVIINGGKVTATILNSATSNRYEAALIGGGGSGHGYVTINGGTVIANGHPTSNGAAIGGGTSGTGNVFIHGGTVIATIPSGGNPNGGTTGNGAAIGGGRGSGSATSGIGNVTITGGHVIATGRNGAAIGGGLRSSNATINISGGIIEATTTHGEGAAIGGGGGGVGTDKGVIGGNLSITISGGVLTLNAEDGAAIGHGGYERASVSSHDAKTSGTLTITGGKITAIVRQGNGIGTGWDNKLVPELRIDKAADILVFGKERTAYAGIYAGDNNAQYFDGKNHGSGYYVNLNFPLAGSPIAAGTVFLVYLRDTTSNPVRTITAPVGIGMLSFTTGASNPQDFDIYIKTPAGVQQLSHPSNPRPNPLPKPENVVYNDTRIYSVNRTFDYHESEHVHDTYFRSLPVRVGTGGGTAYYTVDEKYVNPAGESIGLGDSSALVAAGGTYSKTVLPEPAGYAYKGYIWDIKPTGNEHIKGGLPTDEPISSDRLIYFVYDVYAEVNLTVSKEVSGSFADKLKDFTFTIYFTDSDDAKLPSGKSFSYDGGMIPDSGAKAALGGTLTLGQGGSDTFTLKHGQTITIKDVPSDVKIKILETKSLGYTMSYTDSAKPGGSYKSDMEFDFVGINARRFDFLNAGDEIVPTGIRGDGLSLILFSLAAAGLVLAGLMAAGYVKRRCSRGCLNQ
ncbi:MAG: hypothetical protein FWH17_08950 [Oscillospiraceae bacterium]|nr:hypothetical protein [Oscillospiraceae bacterium]